MAYNLAELIDIPHMQLLMDRFHAATGIPIGIIGSDGEVLVATGWQEICTEFHRSHPVTAERCRQSDSFIKSRLSTENCVQYKCGNGLWDLAKPIVIAGEHVASMFLGQFRHDGEDVDEDFFRAQAEEFGFDAGRYLAALRRMPLFSREQVRNIMDFYTSFVDIIVDMGLANYRQKVTEKSLRESEERYRTLFEGANDAIFTICDGRIVNCNKKALEMFRCPPEEFIGRRPEELSPPVQPDGADSREKAREKISHSLAGTPLFFEWRHRRCDGSLFDAEVGLNRLEFTGKVELLAILRDITDRKRAEDALRASEAEKSLILNSTSDLIVYHDRDMKILWGNRQALDSLGLQANEIAGRECWELWHQCTEACYGCPVVSALETGEPRKGEMRGSDGRQWYIRGFPVKDEKGKIKGVVEFCLDVTERKRMEEEIEILNTDLAARACELEAANRELEAFSYTVSHDLRTPLTRVSGYCQVLRELCGERLGEQGAGFVREICGAAEDMNGLITTMLNFSRLSRGSLTRSTVDLSGMARELAARLTMSDPHREITFEIADGAKAEGDEKLLGVVLENLMSNAWKYTAGQGGVLIEFGVAEVEGTPAFFVRDNGPGFDMAQAETLFNPFQRLPGTSGFSGHGIGLSTVQRVIQRHGGRVWAEGGAGRGATFYFTL